MVISGVSSGTILAVGLVPLFIGGAWFMSSAGLGIRAGSVMNNSSCGPDTGNVGIDASGVVPGMSMTLESVSGGLG